MVWVPEGAGSHKDKPLLGSLPIPVTRVEWQCASFPFLCVPLHVSLMLHLGRTRWAAGPVKWQIGHVSVRQSRSVGMSLNQIVGYL